jgi:TetR/AcrR family transcriptional repressor of nem operon
MKASGLTVGGFYKHFRSKDELLADAIAMGFSEFGEKAHAVLKNVPPQDWWKEIVRWYLSPEHCNHPDTGCPVVGVGGGHFSPPPTKTKHAGSDRSRAGAKLLCHL